MPNLTSIKHIQAHERGRREKGKNVLSEKKEKLNFCIHVFAVHKKKAEIREDGSRKRHKVQI